MFEIRRLCQLPEVIKLLEAKQKKFLEYISHESNKLIAKNFNSNLENCLRNNQKINKRNSKKLQYLYVYNNINCNFQSGNLISADFHFFSSFKRYITNYILSKRWIISYKKNSLNKIELCSSPSRNVNDTNLFLLFLKTYEQMLLNLRCYNYDSQNQIYAISYKYLNFINEIKKLLTPSDINIFAVFFNSNNHKIDIDITNDHLEYHNNNIMNTCVDVDGKNSIYNNFLWQFKETKLKSFFFLILKHVTSALISDISFNFDYINQIPKMMLLKYHLDFFINENFKCYTIYKQESYIYRTINFEKCLREDLGNRIDLTHRKIFYYNFFLNNNTYENLKYNDFLTKLINELKEVLHFDKKSLNSYNVRTGKNNKEYRYSYIFEVIYISNSGIDDLKFVDYPLYKIQASIPNDLEEIILQENIWYVYTFGGGDKIYIL